MERTALVTGASSGIGLATVLALAAKGYRTVGTVRSAAKAKVVAEAADAARVEVVTELLDVTDADRCTEVVDRIGPVHALVNNAGYGLTGAIEDVDDIEAGALIDTMVMAPMRLARLVLPAMREAGAGRIVNVSSIYGRTTTPLTGWYQAAKHAIEALSDALRMEVAGDGVKVVLIEPGGFRTGIWDDLQRDIEERGGSRFGPAYKRTQQLIALSSPIMGDPERCAKVIAGAIASSRPRARYLVGYDARALAFTDRFTPTIVKDTVTRFTFGL